MKTAIKKLYEGLFLVDSAEAAADWDGIITRIKNVLEKAGAEIVSMKKWDERKLAYEINGKARGTYILCYFRAGGESIQEIERQSKLSEQIIRVLILCADHISQADIEEDALVGRTEKSQQQAAEVEKIEPGPGTDKPAAEDAEGSKRSDVNDEGSATQQEAVEDTSGSEQSESKT